MKVVFDRSFTKSLNSIKDKNLFNKIELAIIAIEEAQNISQLPSIKKLKGFKTFYRIRIGDYRLGFELENSNTVRILIIAHRKEIYKYFP